jgi:SAM-dependent methyltransferase
MRASDRASYDELYRSAPVLWSGRPNRQLVVEAGELRPGAALDAGSGEGGDAQWLAERGWRVTAVDFSTVALERAAALAAARGLAERIQWLNADLGVWTPPEAGFDLVTAHYLHSTGADRPALFRRLAAAVAPGGTLLVVGHLLGDGDGAGAGHGHGHGHGHGDKGEHGDQHGDGQLHRHDPDAFYTAEDVAAVLDPAEWVDVVTETRARDTEAESRTGNPAPDTVLVARRRAR